MIYHISDLHLSKDRGKNVEVAARLQLLRTVMTKDDLLVVTGDLTDDGDPEQYREAKRLLKPFAGQLFLVAGNHDMGKWGNFYDSDCIKRWQALCKSLGAPAPVGIGRTFQRLWGVPGEAPVLLLGLDACCRTMLPLDFAQGEVGGYSLRWLRETVGHIRLDDPKAKVVVALHHDPLGEKWVERLQDRDEFLRETYGVVDAVLYGHDHGAAMQVCPRGIATVLHRAPAFRGELRFSPLHDVRTQKLGDAQDWRNPFWALSWGTPRTRTEEAAA